MLVGSLQELPDKINQWDVYPIIGMRGGDDYEIYHDMDLIEVLWKQDVDLGFSLDLFTPPKSPMLDEKPDKEHEPQDELEKLKALQASAAATEAAEKRRTNIMEVMSLWPAFPRRHHQVGSRAKDPTFGSMAWKPNKNRGWEEPKVGLGESAIILRKDGKPPRVQAFGIEHLPSGNPCLNNPWLLALLLFVVDSVAAIVPSPCDLILLGLREGECVLKPSIGDVLSDPSSVEELRNSSNTAVPGEQPSALIDLPLFSLEEALQLVGLDEESTQQNTPSDKESFAEEHKAAPPVVVVPSTSEEEGEEKVEKQQQVESDEEPSLLSDMIQTAQFHHPHPHPRAFQAFYKTEPAPAGNSRVDDDDEEDQDNDSLMGQFTLPIASYTTFLVAAASVAAATGRHKKNIKKTNVRKGIQRRKPQQDT
uniref:Uncharacterized protein n=1 Tax=Timema bartmani TaxID=61472 RepID=A0A7R9EV20_9NEOP|nr:unnamed protein product [Timema bartmani]